MYIYFDYSGNLKEIVSYPVRQGDDNSKTIYVYVESSANPQMSDNMYKLPTNITAASIAFKLVDTDENLGDLNVMTKVSTGLEIPYDKTRDLKYFKYWKKYQFWKYTLQSAQTSANGVVAATVTLSDTVESKDYVLDTFAFNVQASVGIIPDSSMTASQYQYLFSRITALQDSLPSKALIATFNTSSFSYNNSHYLLHDIPVSNFINSSDLIIITWGGCFAICPLTVSGPGRVCAALWNNNGEAQTIRIRYELKSSNTLLDIDLQNGFTPPANFTGYVINYKLV